MKVRSYLIFDMHERKKSAANNEWSPQKSSLLQTKVIIEKSRGEVSPMGQDTIENVS